MNKQELANKIVALGVGYAGIGEELGFFALNKEMYDNLSMCGMFPAEIFVCDWRVVGALLEKCLDAEIVLALIMDEAMRNLGESLSLAITEACVEALS